ncbi:uncharacterized protein [Notamacropus eugenii]|uniref:uncharacterized protein isoform X2 n=1 Tax=Notamacropus eugenii TaxID=9315 RepID=UPI003B66E555
MEEVTKTEDGKTAAERPMDSALETQPALLSHQGEARATALQEPKVWHPGEAEVGAYHLQEEEALSLPGSAEEDEESEAVQAMALGLELQCRLQLHLDQLEAKAKAAATAQGSSEPALEACGSLAAPDHPQPLICQGKHGDPHIRTQELKTVLGQKIKLREKGSSEVFGVPYRGTGWCPREKGEITAEAWGSRPTSGPTSVCQRRQLYPNLERKGQVPEGASTLELTHACLTKRHLPAEEKKSRKLEARSQLQALWQEDGGLQRKGLNKELRAWPPQVPKQPPVDLLVALWLLRESGHSGGSPGNRAEPMTDIYLPSCWNL